MDIGKLYDQNIAGTYDQDQFGLLSGGRNLGFGQIKTHVDASGIRDILDLAAGTGESLLLCRQLFPTAALHGIDLSGEMLDIAKTKLAFNAIHDDVVNTGKHFAPESVDLMLMHFLTTFVDGNAVVQDTAKLLRPGGYYSIVSTTYEAFPRLQALANALLPDGFLQEASPAPLNTETVATYCRNAGLEVVSVDTFTQPVKFFSFEEFYSFGMNSGFFTHILSRFSSEQIAGFSQMQHLLPFEDSYQASVVLAHKS
ncbi:MAG: methyltransferase domain-containing protein [Methylobacter sp.]